MINWLGLASAIGMLAYLATHRLGPPQNARVARLAQEAIAAIYLILPISLVISNMYHAALKGSLAALLVDGPKLMLLIGPTTLAIGLVKSWRFARPVTWVLTCLGTAFLAQQFLGGIEQYLVNEYEIGVYAKFLTIVGFLLLAHLLILALLFLSRGAPNNAFQPTASLRSAAAERGR